MFQRVLIANRGEIAVRVIRTLHELGIEAVAVYSTADRGALHTRLADRAVCIGPPAAAESYLAIPSVIGAAETTGCDAVHPGYGFLAENPAFVRACTDNDLVFIGPGAEVMEEMGDKVRAKAAMEEAGVPVVPGTDGVATANDARAAADDLGYPVLLKAAAGGGGKGMRLVSSAAELEETFQTASGEALAAFGDGRIYVERALVPARHVEVQVLADGDGNVLTLGERECSIQRRHQKLVEESPSPALTPEQREAMEEAAERACRAVGYTNAGTFEFLVGPDGAFHFIELNARLQVEHPVSELVTGLDLVREQLRIASGEPLRLTGRAPRGGHAIEVRINAEDPGGQLRSLTWPCDEVPASARAIRPAGHARRGGNRGIAALRLAAREAHRVGSRPPRGNRPLPPGARRARDRGRAHDARARDRHHAFGCVRDGQLFDIVPRRGRRPAGAGESLMGGRRAARRTALFLLYQWDLTGQPLASLYEGDIDEFSRELAEAVSGEAAELDRMIDEASDEWRADRLGVLERNVMRIGIYELVHGTVPVEVAISEAVNLAKRYASDEAGKLVNGVLARVARERVA